MGKNSVSTIYIKVLNCDRSRSCGYVAIFNIVKNCKQMRLMLSQLWVAIRFQRLPKLLCRGRNCGFGSLFKTLLHIVQTITDEELAWFLNYVKDNHWSFLMFQNTSNVIVCGNMISDFVKEIR